ncbi:hypothetical protein Lesp02_50460 [Lentzea sp. NBRC 105346]|nr:hypothetical protein Lesp02_50460 [Lentzea sp. NBRC 105346]
MVATVALATGLGLFAAGCSAGQVTQTDTQVAAVDGASGDVGKVGVRNAMLAYPHEGNRYQAGEDAPLVVVIVNSGENPDKLLSISSPFATGDFAIEGDTELPARFSLQAGSEGAEAHATGSSTPHPTSSSSAAHSSSTQPSVTGTSTPSSTSSVAPSSGAPSGSSSVKPTSSSKAPELPIGKIKIMVKGLVQEVVAGQTIRVTFLFEKAGPLTLDVPVAPSTEERKSEGHTEGH